MVETIKIDSRDQWLKVRQQDVTASVAGALLGVHDYTTAYALWAEKTGKVSADPGESAAMRRGRLLEPVAIQLLAEDYPHWSVERPGLYLRDPVARLGATPDLYAQCPVKGPGIVQIKTASDHAWRKKWRNPETRETEVPLWIAVQAIVEGYLSGRQWAAVAVMVTGFGLDLHVVEVPIHEGVVTRVKAAVRDFWTLIRDGKTPDPDYGRDAALLERVYGEDNGLALDLSDDPDLPGICDERAQLQAAKADAEVRLKAIKGMILHRMGDHRTARIADGRTITAKTVHRPAYEVKPVSYRDVRVIQAKQERQAA